MAGLEEAAGPAEFAGQLQPELADQAPEFSGYPPRPEKVGGGPPGLVLVGEDYYFGNKKIGKLGRMLELYPG